MSSSILWSILLNPHSGPIFWIGLSLVGYSLGSYLAWTVRWSVAGRPGRLPPAVASRWLANVGQGVRLVYYLALPFLALTLGLVDLPALGLTWPPAPAELRQVLASGAALAALTAATWAHYALRELTSRPVDEAAWPDDSPSLSLPFGWAVIIRDAVFLQAHWAFYRACLAALLPANALANWLALALILVEGCLNPATRHHLRVGGRAEPILLNAQMAVVTTVLVAGGGGTWLALAYHAALALTIPAWVHNLRRLGNRYSQSLSRR